MMGINYIYQSLLRCVIMSLKNLVQMFIDFSKLYKTSHSAQAALVSFANNSWVNVFLFLAFTSHIIKEK